MQGNSNHNAYKWLNAAGLILVIVVNALANILPIGGRTTQEVSELYPVLITPAGYAFIIWSVIYLLLAGFVIFQFLPSQKNRNTTAQVGIWFFISCLANAGWIILWQNLQIGWSVLVILILLFSLIQMYVRTRDIPSPTPGETWFVKLPFSIYLGWVSVATLINITVWLSKLGWSGFNLGDQTWAIILLLLGSIVAFAVSYRYNDFILPLVFVWAYIAIGVKQSDTLAVSYTAIGLAIVIFLFAVWIFLRRKK
ncbi:TspO/MBR family protein [Paenibacillus polygoni]|uniref:TspO/MBR family protein n=1 Tax=Paenibacillus polygoni TaxID=3050112 RepID=A0ABY8X5W4_9BACL|nr:TspO/MBR family protein [Paenibacillus polygoni]WIV19613.1 TspO/MBR family protein [Paenibacillus polygoni]